MNGPAQFDFTTASGVRRTIAAIGPDDVEHYSRLGQAVGVDFGNAFFEGILHCPGFTDRVVAFRILTGADPAEPDAEAMVRAARHMRDATGDPYIAVSFYERRN